MPPLTRPPTLHNAADLRIELLASGAIGRIDWRALTVNLFPAAPVEGGPANLWLRRHGTGGVDAAPLLGPASPLAWPQATGDERRRTAAGRWRGLRLQLSLCLAEAAPAWFWHLRVHNPGPEACTLALLHAQDVGLAPYAAIRLNEYYVSQYVDLAPLAHARHGWMLAARQNLGTDGPHPWLIAGSLRRGVGFATDGLQVHGHAARTGALPHGVQYGLGVRRLQHEHAMVALQDAPLVLAAGAQASLGFFVALRADHPRATDDASLVFADAALLLPQACPPAWRTDAGADADADTDADADADAGAEAESGADDAPPPPEAPPSTPFSTAPLLAARDLDATELGALFEAPWRHPEHQDGTLLSFFHGEHAHVVLRAKELRVQRPHGHLLRSGAHLVPDEAALTSTAWMAGVFHSMVTQGHVGLNRFLSTVRSWLGLYRSHGQRIFVHRGDGWRQLGVPSAFEMRPDACRWFYRHDGGLVTVESRAEVPAHRLTLRVSVDGAPLRLRVTHHVALDGDDGTSGRPTPWRRAAGGVFVGVPAGSELARRFPDGGFVIEPLPGSTFTQVGGDERLWSDGVSRGEPFVCVESGAVTSFGLAIGGRLVAQGTEAPLPGFPDLVSPPPAVEDHVRPPRGRATVPGAAGRQLPACPPPAAEPALALPRCEVPPASALASDAAQLGEILPWFQHNALVHYLAPRGLEQFSGGGWGTRDVCQGPVEMLLALDRPAPVRDLLQRVFSAQNADGDWPQWFMFFEREREIRAGDSHGDIVFWPLLALARYLLASGDAALLDQTLPYHTPRGAAPDAGPLRQHVERALAVIERRLIGGTRLVAYGHGDWNDSLQPADPTLRERLCSAWTVTLHHQTLRELARAFEHVGPSAAATASAGGDAATRPAAGGPAGGGLADHGSARGERAGAAPERAGRLVDAAALHAQADGVRADFRRLLVQGGVVGGYALFASPPDAAAGAAAPAPATDAGAPQLLLHPSDTLTPLRYSLLPMVHAILDDLFTPDEAHAHLALIEQQLLGPDGARLFERPMPYRGGPQRLFQRAESSTFFGREIGVMYMHAHLRYAQALAHVGDAARFFEALGRAHPIGLQRRVPSAGLRQANSYFSSSDAAFADRREAERDYARIRAGSVTLDAGWRIYSSGPGIAIGLYVGSFLGIRREHAWLAVDPVMPAALDGLRAVVPIAGRPVEVEYRLGAQGCGVTRLTLNGAELAFEHGANPYRTGAARVAMDRWPPQFDGGIDRLIVQTA